MHPAIARLRSVARSPGWQLVAGAVALAVLFPREAVGSVGLLALSASAGVGIALQWPLLPAWLRSPPERVATAAIVALVVVAGITTFWDALTVSPDWQLGDWGPQHAVLARAMPSLPGTDVPTWNHTVGTGDAPFELYPKMAYLVTGHTALALGLEDDLPLAMMITAVAVHLLIAAGTTLLAARVAPKPLALIVGLVAVVDSGAVAHGGSVGLFRWALFHSALALAIFVVAALGIVAALQRPRLRASATIWIATALACAAHPAGLLVAGASIAALLVTALLADDVPPRRALFVACHVALGVMIGAFAWMPLAERILQYGQHFANTPWSAAAFVEEILVRVTPTTSFSLVGYAGYFGILAGLWSRRASLVFVCATALVLYVMMTDAPHLAFGIAPGQGIARLGTERLAALARPFLMAAAAYGMSLVVGAATSAWRGAPRARRLIAAAAIGAMVGPMLRVAIPLWRSESGRADNEAHVFAPDPEGRAALTTWAHARAAELRPGAWARALFETNDTHEQFHLTAETGLPTLHMLWQPDLLLRETIEDVSRESLRRFDVRWVIRAGSSPSVGDPATERMIGDFHVRDVAGWDGAFARIEAGDGTVTTIRLDDDAVEIDVRSPGPVLVALGTGYYPRWRATHESGAVEPVYALPATPTGTLHVVAAWVAPGRTTFTCDAPLPSDGAGRLPALAALLACLVILVAWRVPRWRVAILRRFVAVRDVAFAFAAPVARIGVPLVLVVLFVRGCRTSRAPALALRLGSGVRPTATVESRVAEGPWTACTYERLSGQHICPGVATLSDGLAGLVNDATPSWAFTTPSIAASFERNDADVRIRLEARLFGEYWLGTSGGSTRLAVDHEPLREVTRDKTWYPDGVRAIEIVGHATTTATPWEFTFVRQDTLVPPRDYLVSPPDVAPAEVSAIVGSTGAAPSR